MDLFSYETLLKVKKFLKMKIQKKLSILLKKNIDFNKKQRNRGIKILTPKQMLQRLPIVLAQVKTVIHPKTY